MSKSNTESYGIIGLGRFGTALAIRLAESGKEVIVIDNNENKVVELRKYTEYAYVCDNITKEALEEIGIQNCDTVVICIGEAIDTSILLTLNVVNLGVKRVIAKAISPDHGAVLAKLGAEVVYPEIDMALKLAQKLLTNNILEYLSLDDNVEITEIKVHRSIKNKKICDLPFRKKYGINIIAIEHGNKTDVEIDPNYVLEEDDVLVVIVKTDKIREYERRIN